MFSSRRIFQPLVCFFLVSGAAFGPSSPAARAEVIHSPKGYTVTIPNGWQTSHEVHPQAGGYSTDALYTHPFDALPLFRVEVDPQRAATMQTAAAMQAAFIQRKMPGYRVLGQRRRHVAGSPASETATTGPYQGQPVILDMILTIHGGRNYTITLITTPKTVRADLKTFEHILSTLRWTKAA
jgi:hypothetical protein